MHDRVERVDKSARLMTHAIRMLGTGNAFLPHQRHHSFLIFDGKHIIDAPPTALLSLRRAGISPAEIETIFITHLHGDHVFGLPFLLLEKKYISDREGNAHLTIVGSSGVKARLKTLCNLAFPGSLDDALDTVTFIETDTGTIDGWSWERFHVHHDDAVDPFGYRFEHDDGCSFVHSGDSGPCENLEHAIERSQLAVVEMGFPQWVPSDHHHKPDDIQSLAERQSHVKLLITHTFVDTPQSGFEPILTDELPDHPENVHHLEDGDVWNFQNSEWVPIKN